MEDPIWMEMINKGMFYVETIRCRCEWIITPTLLQLTMHVPSMLYQLRKFNIENEYNLTMRDLDDNCMELLNKMCKKCTKNHNNKSDASLEVVFRSVVIQVTGAMEYGTRSYHVTEGQKKQLEHNEEFKSSTLEGFSDISKEIMEALRENKPIPHVDDSLMSVKLKKIKGLLLIYDEEKTEINKLMKETQKELLNLKSKKKVKVNQSNKKRTYADLNNGKIPQNTNSNRNKKRSTKMRQVPDAFCE